MTVLQAIILGIIQGIAEMLPISSSGHLNVVPWVLGWRENEEFLKVFDGAFDVALHFGTLVAIGLYFLPDWLKMLKGAYRKVLKKEDSFESKMFFYLVISTIPAAILALVLDKVSELIVGDNFLLEMGLIGVASIIMGCLLFVVDKKSSGDVKYENISFKQAFIIAISQAVAAAFPGVSRSGITITTARALNVDRASSAKFSFLLSTPMVAAAVIKDLGEFEFKSLPFWMGVVTSFIVGLVVIRTLMNYLKKGSFKIFAMYRIIFGLLIFGFIIFK